MKTPRLPFLVALAVAALLTAYASACSGDKPVAPPVGAGKLTVTLTTPNTTDAALFFELRGPAITALTSVNSSAQLYADSAGSPIRGAIFGPLASGALLTFHVPDTTNRSAYSAAVLDVADRDNTQRPSLTGYSLTVAP